MRLPARVLLALPLLAALVAAGCGSTSSGPAGSIPTVKIQEYVGDGHHGTKALPPFWPLSGAQTAPVRPQTALSGLTISASPRTSNVLPRSTDWYYVPPLNTGGEVLVTVQPTNKRDSDLYVLEGRADWFTDDATTLGYSNRAPSGSGDVIAGGYAPDWVRFGFLSATDGFPAAYVAIYGDPIGASGGRYFTVEADWAHITFANQAAATGTLQAGDSNWFMLWADPETAYTARLSAVTGDPDLYVYGGTSSEFVGSSTGGGGGTVAFTSAAGSGWLAYCCRVYAYSACKYSFRVTSP